MKLKLDTDGHVVVQDGKPVYVKDDGTEEAFDAAQTIGKIAALNGEAKSHREAKEAAEAQLKQFEGLDPEKAKAALETVGNLDAKKLVDAGEIEKVRAEIKKSFDPVVQENEQLKGKLNDVQLSHQFATSKFVQDNVAIPHDFLKANFAKNFSFDGDNLVAKDGQGNTIFSPAGNGNNANFDEAIEHLIKSHPQKDTLLKATGSNGSGSEPNKGQNSGTKQVTRSTYSQMQPAEQTSFIREGGTVVDG